MTSSAPRSTRRVAARCRKRWAAAQAEIEAIDAEIITIQDERDAAIEAYVRLADANDQGFERAVDALAQALGSANVQTLVTEARLLPSGSDDPLVSQLNDARLRIVEEQTDTRDEEVRLRTLAARRRELEDIEYEFKALKFDDPRSLFRDDDLAAARLGSFLTGATTAPSYWRRGGAARAGASAPRTGGGGVGLPRHGRAGRHRCASGGRSVLAAAGGVRRGRELRRRLAAGLSAWRRAPAGWRQAQR